MKRTFTEEVELEMRRRYEAGESLRQLADAYPCSLRTVQQILARNGCKRRTAKSASREVRRVLTVGQERYICGRYLAGETTIELAAAYGVGINTINRLLVRKGHDVRRRNNGFGDTIQHALDGTGRHDQARDCSFYLFELANYANTHCKPGIAFDVDVRAYVSGSQYGVEALRLVYGTRQEAFFLEQAVLDATKGCAQCPEGLAAWVGATEVRAMPAEDMLPIVARLVDELEELGVWAFAAAYVPMTAAQRATCQQRALANAPVLSSASAAE